MITRGTKVVAFAQCRTIVGRAGKGNLVPRKTRFNRACGAYRFLAARRVSMTEVSLPWRFSSWPSSGELCRGTSARSAPAIIAPWRWKWTEKWTCWRPVPGEHSRRVPILIPWGQSATNLPPGRLSSHEQETCYRVASEKRDQGGNVSGGDAP